MEWITWSHSISHRITLILQLINNCIIMCCEHVTSRYRHPVTFLVLLCRLSGGLMLSMWWWCKWPVEGSLFSIFSVYIYSVQINTSLYRVLAKISQGSMSNNTSTVYSGYNNIARDWKEYVGCHQDLYIRSYSVTSDIFPRHLTFCYWQKIGAERP